MEMLLDDEKKIKYRVHPIKHGQKHKVGWKCIVSHLTIEESEEIRKLCWQLGEKRLKKIRDPFE